MCGIGGIRRYGKKPIPERMIRAILLGLEHRGADSTGIALQKKDGEVIIYKLDQIAWNFCISDGYKQFLKEHLTDDVEQVLLHTRAATGNASPRFNKNNHPLFAGKAAIIHNGVLHNDDQLFKELKLERNADTDTDVIRAIIDKTGFTDETMQNLNKIRGSAAIAALHPAYPGKMLLGRSGNPIVMGSTDDFFMFASEKDILHQAMRPWTVRFNIQFQQQTPEMAFAGFPDDTLWVLGEKGYEEHVEFRTTTGTYREPNRRIYTGFQERQSRWNSNQSDGPYQSSAVHTTATESNTTTTVADGPKEKVKVVVTCPKCQKQMGLSPEMHALGLGELQCPTKRGGCGTPLIAAKVN